MSDAARVFSPGPRGYVDAGSMALVHPDRRSGQLTKVAALRDGAQSAVSRQLAAMESLRRPPVPAHGSRRGPDRGRAPPVSARAGLAGGGRGAGPGSGAAGRAAGRSGLHRRAVLDRSAVPVARLSGAEPALSGHPPARARWRGRGGRRVAGERRGRHRHPAAQARAAATARCSPPGTCWSARRTAGSRVAGPCPSPGCRACRWCWPRPAPSGARWTSSRAAWA